MIIDGALLFSTAQAVTTTAPSTNIVDLGVKRDIGIGDNPSLKVMVMVTTAFTTTNSGTLQVAFQGSTDNTTWDTYTLSPAYAAAALTVGARLHDIDVPRPGAGQAAPRYIRLNYVVGTGAFTAGALTATVLGDRQENITYAPGTTVIN